MLATIGSELRVQPSRHAPVAREAGPAYALVAGTMLLDAVLMAAGGFSLAGIDFHVVAVLTALLLLVAFSLRGRGWGRVATVLESWVLLYTFGILAVLATMVAASGGLPLVDAELARVDRLLFPGLDWPSAMRALLGYPATLAVLNFAYGSFGWQPLLLLALCALTGRPERCWTFTLAWFVSLLITVAVYAVVPALGPYPFFGMAASDVPLMRDTGPWTAPEIVRDLRSGALRSIEFVKLDGLVPFPSFHAGGAVLLAWGFAAIGWARTPALVLNGAMIAAAVPIGGHYLVDIVGGVAVAAAGIAAARAIERAHALSVRVRASEHPREDRVHMGEVVI